jgi:hypothetical protein
MEQLTFAMAEEYGATLAPYGIKPESLGDTLEQSTLEANEISACRTNTANLNNAIGFIRHDLIPRVCV